MVHGSTLASSIKSRAHCPSLPSNTIRRRQLQGAYELMRHHGNSSSRTIQYYDVRCLEYTTQRALPLFRADDTVSSLSRAKAPFKVSNYVCTPKKP